jgi:hypothetical protein
MVSNEEKMLKERIKHLLVYKKMTISNLTDDEVLYKRLRRQINDEALVPFSTIHMLLYMFPDISADWLVMGEGLMRKAEHTAPRIYNTKNEVNNSTAGGSINVGTTTIPVSVQALLDEKDRRIKELEQDKQLLQGLLSAFTKTTK